MWWAAMFLVWGVCIYFDSWELATAKRRILRVVATLFMVFGLALVVWRLSGEPKGGLSDIVLYVGGLACGLGSFLIALAKRHPRWMPLGMLFLVAGAAVSATAQVFLR